MPVATSSLVAYQQSIFTAVDGTSYKGILDADTAISSNISGALYVYPNSPAGLSVRVDASFNVPQVGQASSTLLNGAASPIVVSLTAPVSNSYYACVYWDLSTATAGVVFGPSAVSPVPMIPDSWTQVALALVLLSAGQSSVTASNISDIRTFIFNRPVTRSLGTVAVNQTVNCQGATSVKINFTMTASLSLILTNIRTGTHLSLSSTNSTGGNLTLKIIATTPSGTSIPVNGKTSGAATLFHDIGTAGAGFVWPATTSFIVEGEVGSSLDVTAS